MGEAVMNKYEHLFESGYELAAGHVEPSKKAREILAHALERRGRKGTANKLRQGRNHGFWEYLEAVELALRINDPRFAKEEGNEPD